jgi:hypothetical protein
MRCHAARWPASAARRRLLAGVLALSSGLAAGGADGFVPGNLYITLTPSDPCWWVHTIQSLT